MKYLLIFLLLFPFSLLAQKKQGHALIDSLLKELPKQKEDTNKVNLLAALSQLYYSVNNNEGIKYGQRALSLASKLDWKKGIGKSNNLIGINYLGASEYSKSIEYNLAALKIYDESGPGFNERKSITLGLIVDGYTYQNKFSKALTYYREQLEVTKNQNELPFWTGILFGIFLFVTLYNIFIFFFLKDKSIKFVIYALILYFIDYVIKTHKIENRIEEYFCCLGFIITIFLLSKAYRKFVENFLIENEKNIFSHKEIVKNRNMINIIFSIMCIIITAVFISKLHLDYNSLFMTTRMISDLMIFAQIIYILLLFFKNKVYKNEGVRYITAGAFIVIFGLIITLVYKYLYNIDNHAVDISFLTYSFLLSISVSDKINFLKLQKEKAQENALLFLENRVMERTNELAIQKKKSDDLLLSILPEEVAEELKEKGSSAARHFDNVTVLFTDFVGFTIAGERMNPQQLVDELHTCFKTFDEIIGKYNIEKIKTIGDAYLAVCGLPLANAQHAENVVKAAVATNRYMEDRYAKLGDRTFRLRIGVNTGSVVAGIVGVKKFAYDIWGDTVNTAARMEQNSEAGRINISQTTYELVKDKFACEYRGEIDAKGKGMLKMYFVS